MPPRHRPQPVDRESRFEFEELFFSRTDRKGIIRSGNDVFVRVSEYAPEDLIGSPHNVIRHPDMPRCVFQVLWDTILEGRPIAAYVKNMARSGAYYWVLATVVPDGDGFLSVRLKPSGPLLGAVEAVYPELRALEEEMEASGATRPEAVAASRSRLLELLRSVGFADYTAFMHAALPAEIRLREGVMRDRGTAEGDDARSPAYLRLLHEVSGQFDRLFADAEALTEATSRLTADMTEIRQFAESARLSALNARIACSRLGSEAASLSVVADLLGTCAGDVTDTASVLDGIVDGILGPLNDLSFQIALCKVQVDSATFFAREIAAASGDAGQRFSDLTGLVRRLAQEVEDMLSAQAHLAARLAELRSGAERLAGHLRTLSALHVSGRVEVASVAGAEGVAVLFEEIRAQLVDTDAQMADLVGATRLAEHRVDESLLRHRLHELEEGLAELAA